MAKAEIMDLTAACQSFPEIPVPQIRRDNILDTIDMIFEGNTELIVVEGVEGIGKTTLLAQFAMRHPNHALSLFIKPTSRFAYDPGILRFDLCNQLRWTLHQEELKTPEDADDAFLRNHLLELRKRARRNRETFYFIVDGIDEIPEGFFHSIDGFLKRKLEVLFGNREVVLSNQDFPAGRFGTKILQERLGEIELQRTAVAGIDDEGSFIGVIG